MDKIAWKDFKDIEGSTFAILHEGEEDAYYDAGSFGFWLAIGEGVTDAIKSAYPYTKEEVNRLIGKYSPDLDDMYCIRLT